MPHLQSRGEAEAYCALLNSSGVSRKGGEGGGRGGGGRGGGEGKEGLRQQASTVAGEWAGPLDLQYMQVHDLCMPLTFSQGQSLLKILLGKIFFAKY